MIRPPYCLRTRLTASSSVTRSRVADAETGSSTWLATRPVADAVGAAGSAWAAPAASSNAAQRILNIVGILCRRVRLCNDALLETGRLTPCPAQSTSGLTSTRTRISSPGSVLVRVVYVCPSNT